MIHNWTIYMYTFPDGKRYVGATTRGLQQRQDSKESGWYRYRNCSAVWNAIQKFGVENIKQEILFQGEIDDVAASEMERFYIAHFKTNCRRYNHPSYGYNCSDGGDGTQEKHLSEERRKELKQQMRILGRAQTGTHPSDETRRRLSAAKQGRKRGPMSDETKRKISAANSRENMTEETHQHRSDSKKQPVAAYDPVDGTKFVFESHDQAADFFGVRSSAVSRWISGKRNPSNGFQFSNIEEDREEVKAS